MTSKEALRKIITNTLKYLPNETLDKNSKLSNIVLQDLEKLEKLEDLEEELGIDFITLFKVIKEDQIYYKFFNEIQCWSPIKIELRKGNIYFARQVGGKYSLRQPLSNYGKTWALTREELLGNDK